MPSAEESQLYMIADGKESRRFLDLAKEYWNQIKPQNVGEAIASVLLPTPYQIWKLPPEVHKKMNDILGVAADIAFAAGPEAEAAVGLAYGISQAIYGFKTQSGKHAGAGLVGIAEGIKRLGNEEHKPLLETIESVLRNYFHNPPPAYARA